MVHTEIAADSPIHGVNGLGSTLQQILLNVLLNIGDALTGGLLQGLIALQPLVKVIIGGGQITGHTGLPNAVQNAPLIGAHLNSVP